MVHLVRLDRFFLGCHTIAIFTVAAFLMAGCTALPKTSGYTSATIQVRQAVATAGSAVEAELESAIFTGAVSPSSTRVKRFKQSWNKTVASMDAMVTYAQSIEQIVAAGNKGAESAKQLADSVTRLVDTIKVDAATAAGAEVVELSSQTVAFVYGEYTKFLASKSLQETLDLVGPSIAKVSTLVQMQIADAERLFVEQIEAQLQELEAEYKDWIKQQERLANKQQTAIQQLLALIALPSSPANSPLTEAVKEAEGPEWSNLSASQREARVEELRKEKIKKLETAIGQLETSRKMIAPHIEKYEVRVSQIRQRDQAGRIIIRASENAVAAWNTAHQDLVEAIKQRKPVSVESLTAAVVEIRTLIQRWREL